MNMDIITAISSVGFPIVACLLLGYYVKILMERSDNRDAETRREHKEEVKQMTDAINNNNILLQRILDKLDKEV